MDCIILYNKVIIIILISIFIFPIYIAAHSGGTDSNGGHHCWTDCENYGYDYGEYHYHGTTPPNSNRKNQYVETSDSAATFWDYIWIVILGYIILMYIIGLVQGNKK